MKTYEQGLTTSAVSLSPETYMYCVLYVHNIQAFNRVAMCSNAAWLFGYGMDRSVFNIVNVVILNIDVMSCLYHLWRLYPIAFGC